MDFFADYRDMMLLFNKYKVKYLIVGAYAMGNYGYSRHTLDIDLWVEKSKENAQKILKAFEEYPVPHEVSIDELNMDNFVLQIGIESMRIDVLTDIDGVDFASAWEDRTNNSLFDQEINFISLSDLIKNKSSTDRPKDKYDLLELEKIQKNRYKTSN